MLSPVLAIAALGAYMAFLFAIALWAERRGKASSVVNSRWVYILSLAVYCTSWTFYGSVGVASRQGFLFLTIYLGPTLVWLMGGTVIRRMVRFKEAYRVSNLADFLAARYGHAAGLAALVSVMAVVAIIPYTALQLKAILTTFHIVVNAPRAETWEGARALIEGLVVGFVVVLTIAFGLRHLDPTERHRGMMVMLATESLVKLIAFIAAGLFVTYGMYGGFADLFDRLAVAQASGMAEAKGLHHDGSAQWYSTFLTWTILAMAAIIFLPRQFHVTVVENANIDHVRSAMWLFPLYLLLINIFVYPIAAGGILDGHPARLADTFVLLLPLSHGAHGLALLVFIGGFSAAVGMVMVCSMTLAVMVSNNLVMPMAERLPLLGGLRRHVLRVRWVAVTAIILAGYGFERIAGNSHFLVNMGILSFAGVLQFAPAMLGGMFWRHASRTGALWGLSAGFAVWLYTLLFPALLRSGWGSSSLLTEGPFGLSALRPEALFGFTTLPALSHGVLWSLIANIGGLVLGSSWRPAGDDERRAISVLRREGTARPLTSGLEEGPSTIDMGVKARALTAILGEYMPRARAEAVIATSLAKNRLAGRDHISPVELVRFFGDVETALAGSIGAAAARTAMRKSELLSEQESEAIARIYSKILADLHLTPEELRQRVDYYQERHEIINRHAEELSDKVERLKQEIFARAKAESALRESEERFRTMADTAPVMIWIAELGGGRSYFNRSWLAFTGRLLDQELEHGWLEGVAPEDSERCRQSHAEAFACKRHYTVEYRLRRHDGEYRWITEQGTPRLTLAGTLVGYIGSCLDITDLKAAEGALRRSRDEQEALVATRTAELRHTNASLQNEIEQRRRAEESLLLTQCSMDRAMDAVFWIGNDARLLYANDAACQSLGYTREELLALTVFDVDPNYRPEDWAAQWQLMRARGAALIETTNRTKDGRIVPIEVSINHLEFGGKEYYFAFARDISERKRAEQSLLDSYAELKRINQKLEEAQLQLLQSEKLASIGQLAAGVAHEINNPIGFVSSNLTTLHGYVLELLRLIDAYERLEGKSADPGGVGTVRALKEEVDLEYLREDIPALLKETLDGVMRVQQIVKDLKDFSQVDEAEWQEADLHAGLESTLNVVRSEIKYKAQVVKEYGELPTVRCIPSQLNQVFMNLLMNAAQAIPEKGTIIVRTGRQEAWVWIEVVDTGKGIPPENLNRIFEPFFTTKPVGKGIGLGLSVSYGIVKKHGGRIEVSSEVGRRTAFKVWLPIRGQQEAA